MKYSSWSSASLQANFSNYNVAARIYTKILLNFRSIKYLHICAGSVVVVVVVLKVHPIPWKLNAYMRVCIIIEIGCGERHFFPKLILFRCVFHARLYLNLCTTLIIFITVYTYIHTSAVCGHFASL